MFPNLARIAWISRCISLILSDSVVGVLSTDMSAAVAFLGRTAASISAAAVRSFSLVSRLCSFALIWALISLCRPATKCWRTVCLMARWYPSLASGWLTSCCRSSSSAS